MTVKDRTWLVLLRDISHAPRVERSWRWSEVAAPRSLRRSRHLTRPFAGSDRG
ncbi:MAG: hypothetical protein ABSH30_13750 [Acidimicrobiales bacterium]